VAAAGVKNVGLLLKCVEFASRIFTGDRLVKMSAQVKTADILRLNARIADDLVKFTTRSVAECFEDSLRLHIHGVGMFAAYENAAASRVAAMVARGGETKPPSKSSFGRSSLLAQRTGAQPGSKPICRGFNSADGCKFKGTCSYQHKCSNCGGSHPKAACSNATSA
jgi:hypothetical protein